MEKLANYIFRRLLSTILILFIIASVNFLVFRLMPGDPVMSMIEPGFSQEDIEQLYKQFGLDKSLGQQYILYIKNLGSLEFGHSFYSGRAVITELKERLPNTVLLLGTSLVFTMLLGVTLGILAAYKQKTLIDYLTIGSSLYAHAMPTFFFQLILLMIFGGIFHLFPVSGSMSVPPPTELFPRIIDRVYHMVLPVFSLVIIGMGSWALYVRNSMVDVLEQGYIVTARAKGLNISKILFHHAFKSILPSVITLAFLSLPQVISGAVITETVFSWHGVGRYLLQAVLRSDYPAAQGAFFMMAIAVVFCNLLADIVYGVVDPRIRVGAGEGR